MKHITVIEYLLGAIERAYIDKIEFKRIEREYIEVLVYVIESAITSVLAMIEANMYTRKELLAKRVDIVDKELYVECFNDMRYRIRVERVG